MGLVCSECGTIAPCLQTFKGEEAVDNRHTIERDGATFLKRARAPPAIWSPSFQAEQKSGFTADVQVHHRLIVGMKVAQLLLLPLPDDVSELLESVPVGSQESGGPLRRPGSTSRPDRR